MNDTVIFVSFLVIELWLLLLSLYVTRRPRGRIGFTGETGAPGRDGPPGPMGPMGPPGQVDYDELTRRLRDVE